MPVQMQQKLRLLLEYSEKIPAYREQLKKISPLHFANLISVPPDRYTRLK